MEVPQRLGSTSNVFCVFSDHITLRLTDSPPTAPQLDLIRGLQGLGTGRARTLEQSKKAWENACDLSHSGVQHHCRQPWAPSCDCCPITRKFTIFTPSASICYGADSDFWLSPESLASKLTGDRRRMSLAFAAQRCRMGRPQARQIPSPHILLCCRKRERFRFPSLYKLTCPSSDLSNSSPAQMAPMSSELPPQEASTSSRAASPEESLQRQVPNSDLINSLRHS